MLTIKPFLNKSYKKVVFSEEKRQESMKEYENMKNRIYKDTIKYGAIITSYSFLSHGPVNGLSSIVVTTSVPPSDNMFSSFSFLSFLANL